MNLISEMNPIALGIYVLGILMFVGGILFFLIRKRKVGIVVAVLGILIAIFPFAVNIWLAHG